MPGDLFDLTVLPRSALARAAVRAARPLLRRALGLGELGRLYRGLPPGQPDAFASLALRALDISAACDEDNLGRVARAGALILAANHPHGALDGLVLLHLVRRVRPDVKILANHWLRAIPELRPSCFFVDPFGGPGAAERSRAGLRAAHLWLRQGGAVVVFPAGEVSPTPVGASEVFDGPWQPTLGRLALATGAPIVPCFIAGRNSRWFYGSGRIHPAARTLLLVRELLGKRETTVRVWVGEPWRPFADASRDPVAVTARVRRSVDDLRLTSSHDRSSEEKRVAEEVRGLPAEACLVSSSQLRVFCVEAHAIPRTLREIGRLRAITYHAIGEGPSTDCDLDAFDRHYLHLFEWDDEAQRVVGAYRIGRTDGPGHDDGCRALYTRSLFAYDQRLLDRLGPALELGRSFVRAEYQRHPSALLLLWKGICRFVALHPRYRRLFGPVSVSARYSDASHALLMAFLEQNHRAADLASLVTALTPPARRAPAGVPADVPRTAAEASARVAALEPDGKTMPVLLRQYLKLNAEVLAFNVDPDFGHALDALMVVDLLRVDRAILARYFGRDEAARFLSHHIATSQAA